MNAPVLTPAPLDVLSCPLEGVNLIEASAGTGKTWTICGLYLRLLTERKLTVQQILVVTFTNAATAELRARIRSRIVDLLTLLKGTACGAPEPFLRDLARDLGERGMTAEDVVSRLELALHSFDEAAVLTIHGFCQRALADNPFAAGLPMRSELLESDQDLLLDVAHDFWRRHVAHDSVTPEFARYIEARADTPEKYARLLKRHLAKPLARHIWPAALNGPPVATARLGQSYQDARTQWLTHRDHIGALLTAALGSLHGSTYKAKSLLEAATHWDAICGDDDPHANVEKKAHLFRASMLERKTNGKRITPRHAFFGHAETYLALRDQHDQAMYLRRCRLIERLFVEGTEYLREIKRSRQVVAFDDMLANVHERLRNPDYPWLATSIRARFPAALIDEFQDTDPVQLAIFRKIYDADDASVFLVGDPKQAIYSFRHADLHSYLRATQWASRQWSLTHNQRSSAALLTGLNGLFGGNSGAFMLPGVRYRSVEYGAKPRARFVDRSDAGGTRAPLQLWRLPDSARVLLKPQARRAAVDATAAEIARLLQAGRDGAVELDGRALRPGDIAVLVRTRTLAGDVKRALATLRVGAVELSRDSIFASPEAKDWASVLTAIASPSRDALLRAALATELLGCDATQIEAIVADDHRLSAWMAQFMSYRDLWVNRGFGVMYRQLFADQAVAKRLLTHPDGERRLTNCLHVGEELQQAAQSHASPDALLRYLKAAQEDDAPNDTTQLRLESDRNLVQIVTIHTAKGLEYPIVFCPFLGDGSTRAAASRLDGREYHDGFEPVIDFDCYEQNDPRLLAIKAQIKLEQAAETVRLLYVALTRAVHRCYIVVGPYQVRNDKEECGRSMLNWLVAGNGLSPKEWFDSTTTTPRLDAAWQSIAAASGGAMVIDPLPMTPGVALRAVAGDAATLNTPPPPVNIPAGWRMSSYSALSYGAQSERAAGDHDARASPIPELLNCGDDVAADDILRFPRGADAGECVHAVFESIDFTDRSGWESAIASALSRFPLVRVDDAVSLSASILSRMLMQLVTDVTSASLRPGLQLASVALNRRLTELEFNLPVAHLAAGALNVALKNFGYDVPSLTFAALEGYLKGFIDLVFEHCGQYFILDWKSNHLGYTAADYGGPAMTRAMGEHGYHLQYLLYSLALDRYLQLRLTDYQYGTRFGGILYLFVRGVRPAWPGRDGEVPGVFFHRPPATVIHALNQLLGTPTRPRNGVVRQ